MLAAPPGLVSLRTVSLPFLDMQCNSCSLDPTKGTYHIIAKPCLCGDDHDMTPTQGIFSYVYCKPKSGVATSTGTTTIAPASPRTTQSTSQETQLPNDKFPQVGRQIRVHCDANTKCTFQRNGNQWNVLCPSFPDGDWRRWGYIQYEDCPSGKTNDGSKLCCYDSPTTVITRTTPFPTTIDAVACAAWGDKCGGKIDSAPHHGEPFPTKACCVAGHTCQCTDSNGFYCGCHPPSTPAAPSNPVTATPTNDGSVGNNPAPTYRTASTVQTPAPTRPADEATVDGATVDGATTDGATANGATADGATADGATAPTRPADGVTGRTDGPTARVGGLGRTQSQ